MTPRLLRDFYKHARAMVEANEAHVHQCNEVVEDLEGLAQPEVGHLSDVANEQMEDMIENPHRSKCGQGSRRHLVQSKTLDFSTLLDNG
jgi:hypothetical protein